MKFLTLILLSGFLFLGACQTPEQAEAARRAKQIEREQIQAKRDQVNDQHCRKYGLKLRSKEYAECRVQLDIANKHEDEEWERYKNFRNTSAFYGGYSAPYWSGAGIYGGNCLDTGIGHSLNCY